MIKTYKDFLLNEGINDIKEFTLMVNNIILFFTEANYPIINRIHKRGTDNIHFNCDSESIRDICNYEDFPILGKFILKSNVRIYFVLDSISSGGVYANYNIIKINQSNKEFLDNIKYNLNITEKDADDNSITADDCKRILRTALGVAFRSVLLHELQHAYDDFRSKGKYTHDKLSQDYYKKLKYAYDDVKSKMSEEERKIYLSLPHEYWARFNEFLSDISAFNFKRKGLKFFLDYFKQNFVGYEHISDDAKKRLSKALYKFYILNCKS